MKIYKIADAPFRTFGLEDMVFDSFMRHYKNITHPQYLAENQKYLNRNMAAIIGSTNIRNYVAKIIEHYGKPKSPIPYQMELAIISPKHPDAKKFSALMQHDQGKFEMSVVLRSPKITDLDVSRLKEHIGHELEHFLKAVYRGTDSYYNRGEKELKQWDAPVDKKPEEYWSNYREIQAYGKEWAIELIAEYENIYRIRTKNIPNKTVIDSMENSKEKIIRSMVAFKVKNLLNSIERIMGKPLLPEIRKAYYIATMKGFSTLFDEFINRKKNELV